jgi:crossover junction endodeoxyribonuclease RusA
VNRITVMCRRASRHAAERKEAAEALIANGITFTVYGKAQPKGSARAFPFQDRSGRLHVNVTSDNPRLKGWERLVKFEAKAALRNLGHADQAAPPFTGAVAIGLRFGLSRPKSAPPTRRPYPIVKPDLDKLIRAAVDPLIGVLFKDDAQVCKFHDPEKFYVDDGCAFAEITVSHYTPTPKKERKSCAEKR